MGYLGDPTTTYLILCALIALTIPLAPAKMTSLLPVELGSSLVVPNRTIEVRLSRELPTFAMIAFDEKLFFTPYLRERNTLRLPAIELNSAKNEIDLYFREHFDGLWRVATPATYGSDTP